MCESALFRLSMHEARPIIRPIINVHEETWSVQQVGATFSSKVDF